jgi:ubiquinone/menaquinone biosynthesis C-methylase UbiE
LKKNFIKIILRKIKRILDKIFGDLTDEIYFRFIHLFKNRWKEIYLDTILSPHREYLINLILNNKDIKKILELGCGDGVNLRLISKKNNFIETHGVDINKFNIKRAALLNAKFNLNINFYHGNIKKLKMFEDNKFDIVFTDATLLYIDNNNIKKTIEEAIRVSRNKIHHYFVYFFRILT